MHNLIYELEFDLPVNSPIATSIRQCGISHKINTFVFDGYFDLKSVNPDGLLCRDLLAQYKRVALGDPEYELAYWDTDLDALIIKYPLTSSDFIKVRIKKYKECYSLRWVIPRNYQCYQMIIKFLYQYSMTGIVVTVNGGEMKIAALMAACYFALADDVASAAMALDRAQE